MVDVCLGFVFKIPSVSNKSLGWYKWAWYNGANKKAKLKADKC